MRFAVDLREHHDFLAGSLVVHLRRQVDDRDVGQPMPRMERHRGPGVRAPEVRPEQHGLAVSNIPVLGFGVVVRPARFQVDVRCPVHLCKFAGSQQLTGMPVNGIVEAVLWCNQCGLSLLAIDVEVGEDNVHRGIEIPAVPVDRLVVPVVFTRLCVDRDN